MKTWKSSVIFLLLIVLTCFVVFMPQIISGQRKENALDTVIHRTYSAGNRPRLTGAQIVRLYRSNSLTFGYSMDNNINDNNVSKESVARLIEPVFGEDEQFFTFLKGMVTDAEEYECRRGSSLIKIDNQPVALNFVMCSCNKGTNHTLEIFYEEKTNTILGLYVFVSGQRFHSIGDWGAFAKKADVMIRSYYENQLHLTKSEYYYNFDVPVTEKEENGYSVMFSINCGITTISNDRSIKETIS